MNRHQLRMAPGAVRVLERLPPGASHAVVAFVTGELLDDPLRVGKALKRELQGLFSARRGPYRIIYAVDETAGAVVIVRISHRADAYRAPAAAPRSSA